MTTYTLTEDLDRDEVGVLCDTICPATNGASNVSAMATGINMAAASKVGSEGSTAAELLVVDVDARVNDVRKCATPSAIVVDVLGRARLTVGDTGKAIFCVVLGCDGSHHDGQV